MRRKVLAFVLLWIAVLQARSALTYKQLKDFLQSSVRLEISDKEVANYLKSQKLDFALTDALIEEFQGWGIGPRTLQILRKLQPETRSLPPPKISETDQRPQQPPPPSKEEQDRIIAEARHNALDYTKRLPDFICLQVTRRYVDPSGLEIDWLKYDEIKTRVSYVDKRENYELVSVNNQLTNRSVDELGGATSTGEFGSMLAELFSPQTRAEFRWARHSLLRGRGVYVFHFRVSKHRSHWRVSYQRESEIVTGYKGLVYIDKETERVLRITMEAENIPSDFPIQEARTRLDYDFVEISGGEYLLPLKARVGMRRQRFLTRNDVEFRLYRKFSAEATITFEEISDLPPLAEDDTTSGEP